MPTDLAATVLPILEQAGSLALPYQHRVRAERKPDGSPVTEADLAVDRFLVEALSEALPDDGILSEEGGRRTAADGAGTWHVDPIDGTSAFLAGLSYWGPTVCRVDADGRLEAGGFYVPRIGEWWWAERGRGAWRDGERLQAVEPGPIGPDDVLFVSSRVHRGPRLPWPGKLRALGSAAAHLALVAAGGAAAAMVARWELWDVGCGVLLATETGHVVTDLGGRPVDPTVASDGLPLLVGVPTAWKTFEDSPWPPSSPATPPGRNA
jgi:myo-inositol-1(or 4)-monophosphatase